MLIIPRLLLSPNIVPYRQTVVYKKTNSAAIYSLSRLSAKRGQRKQKSSSSSATKEGEQSLTVVKTAETQRQQSVHLAGLKDHRSEWFDNEKGWKRPVETVSANSGSHSSNILLASLKVSVPKSDLKKPLSEETGQNIFKNLKVQGRHQEKVSKAQVPKSSVPSVPNSYDSSSKSSSTESDPQLPKNVGTRENADFLKERLENPTTSSARWSLSQLKDLVVSGVIDQAKVSGPPPPPPVKDQEVYLYEKLKSPPSRVASEEVKRKCLLSLNRSHSSLQRSGQLNPHYFRTRKRVVPPAYSTGIAKTLGVRVKRPKPVPIEKVSSKLIASKITSIIQSMSKKEAELPDMQARQAAKRELRKRLLVGHQPSSINWQVVGSGGPGSPNSLFLDAGQGACYLFNLGEGCQRFSFSHGCRVSYVDNLFITNNSWRNLGGFLGMLLSMRGIGIKKITVHGPPKVEQLYAASSRLINLSQFELAKFEEEVYSDGVMSVNAVSVERSTSLCPTPISKSWDVPWSSDFASSGEETDDENYINSVKAYICKFVPRAGKLDVAKCVKEGVPPGPLLGELKAGKDVTLPDGRIVKAKEVLSNCSPSTSAMILEIPDLNYLDNLLASVPLKGSSHDSDLQNVFHFTQPEVAQDERYQSWMREFPAEVQHVFLNKASKGHGFIDNILHQSKFRLLCPALFPNLSAAAEEPDKSFDCVKDLKTSYLAPDLNAIQAKPGLVVQERPAVKERVSLPESLINKPWQSLQELAAEVEVLDCEVDEFVSGLEQDIKEVQAVREREPEVDQSNLTRDGDKIYPEITFLGTGSSTPSKYRNTSCILVEVEKDSFIILDCGEGSHNQMVNLFGSDRTRNILMKLKAIYISHLHADHHFGLMEFLLERAESFRAAGQPLAKLYIIGTKRYDFPSTYHNTFEGLLDSTELVKCEDLIFYRQKNHDEFYTNDKTRPVHQTIPSEELEALLDYTGLSDIAVCRAIHAAYAYCLTFRTKAGFRISYSGDTRPAKAFEELGRNSDVLIHEASLEHIMMQDAKIKKHSTFTEAIEVGKNMGAKFTLLTHFSQRYGKIPLFGEVEGKQNVGVAFDFMVVNAQTMRYIPSLYPGLKRIFAKELQEMEDKQSAILSQFATGTDGLPVNAEKSKVLEKLDRKRKNLLNKHQDMRDSQAAVKMKKQRLAEEAERRLRVQAQQSRSTKKNTSPDGDQ